MRKVVIGRGRECDVVLADTTDVVSRRQAVIAFTFWGKMTLYDTSSNGTFVNGQRLAKQEAKVVTINDTINFGRVWDLDWNTVKDPYKNTRIALACVVVALLLATCAMFFLSSNHKDSTPEQKVLTTDTIRTDTVKQSPIEQDNEAIEPIPATIQPQKISTKKENSSSPKKNAKSKHASSRVSADSVAVESDDASSKSNEAPLIY